jgi:hypothetical protein
MHNNQLCNQFMLKKTMFNRSSDYLLESNLKHMR